MRVRIYGKVVAMDDGEDTKVKMVVGDVVADMDTWLSRESKEWRDGLVTRCVDVACGRSFDDI
jgi:hypothetical protein